ncbi:MAG: inositol monophosphatase [Armatimonadetes bacterium]|nr:inositol monophosphatase [Armatimonadota bacterium]
MAIPPLEELRELLQAAGQLAIQLREAGLQIETKPDGSLVTNADRAVEEFLRPKLTQLLPGSSVYGEEFGLDKPGHSGLWAVDPIDGTSNYCFGSPLWGVTIGLIQGNQAVMGGIYIPNLDEMYLASKGLGATLNGRPLAKPKPGPIQPYELISYNEWAQRSLPKLPGKQRLIGSIVVEMAFVASGRYRGLAGRRERLYDIAGGLPLLSELGFDVRHPDGTLIDIAKLTGGAQIGPWLAFPPESGYFGKS